MFLNIFLTQILRDQKPGKTKFCSIASIALFPVGIPLHSLLTTFFYWKP